MKLRGSSLLPWLQRTPRSASEWFALVRSGLVDQRLDRQWSQWMAVDADHEKAYESRELAWELSADLHAAPSVRALLDDADSLLHEFERPTAIARACRCAPRWLQPWPAGVAAES